MKFILFFICLKIILNFHDLYNRNYLVTISSQNLKTMIWALIVKNIKIKIFWNKLINIYQFLSISTNLVDFFYKYDL